MFLSLKKSILFFQVVLEPAAVDESFQWALDQALTFPILRCAGKGSANACGCLGFDF